MYNISIIIGGPMNIIKTSKTGFCYGVERSITITSETKNIYPKPYYLLGMLVHNSIVNEELKSKGFEIIDNYEKHLHERATFISTAHGIHEKVKKRILHSGNTLIDTTCPIVIRNNQKIINYFKDNYDIIYFGKHNHQESNVVKDYVHIIENKSDIDKLKIKNHKVVLVNQTTMGIDELKDIENYIKLKYPNSIIDTLICPSTRDRQNELKELLNKYNSEKDFWLVLGDKRSNNTTKLYETTKQNTSNCLFISNIEELENINLDSMNNIILTSGTSTPSSFVDTIYEYLNNKYKK